MTDDSQIVCTGLIGHVDDPGLRDRLAELDHHQLEWVVVTSADAARRRLRLVTDHGHEVLVALDRGENLRDGAVLHLSVDRAVVVRVAVTDALRVRAGDQRAALRLGHRAGSLHWAVVFDDSGVLAVQGVERSDIQLRLADLFDEGAVTWA